MSSRREREHRQHRKEILEAALKVFAQKGYHQASMHEIAHEAEFAVGTLYRFFPGKKALYEAMVLEESQKFHQYIMRAFEDLPNEPLEALKRIINVRLSAIKKHMIFIRVYLRELWEARFQRGFTKELQRLYEEYLDALAKVLNGLGPPHASSKKLAALVDSIISTLVIEAIKTDSELPKTKEILSLLLSPLVRIGGIHERNS